MNPLKVLTVAFMAILLVALASVSAADQSDELKSKVTALLAQLETGPTETERIAAEWELLKLGPDVLPLFPTIEKAPTTIKDRLAGIQATLRELLPRTWTIDEKTSLPLDVIQDKLKTATGLELSSSLKDPQYAATLPPRTSTYWEIVEEVVAKTDLRLSLYEPDGKVKLIHGLNPKLPVSLYGPFRVTLKGATNKLDFETKTHTTTLTLELAWEPHSRRF